VVSRARSSFSGSSSVTRSGEVETNAKRPGLGCLELPDVIPPIPNAEHGLLRELLANVGIAAVETERADQARPKRATELGWIGLGHHQLDASLPRKV
jgi:hypothetical protein